MMNKQKKKVKIYKKKKQTPKNVIIEDLKNKYKTTDFSSIIKFADLPLSQATLKGLKENKYATMTEIQQQSIGLALQGKDILGAAKTGSGKTLAFIIPILEILYRLEWKRLFGVGALVITPTRELAYQIYETLRKVGCHHDFSAGLIIGGKDLKFEKKRMDQCNIMICTPGRLLQHMDENPLFDCNNLQMLVLDEADRCLDMGFEQTMNAIIENLPPQRQTLLYSATQTKSVRDLARLSLKDPSYVSVHENDNHSTPDKLQQSYIICELEDKISVLYSFIRSHLKHKIIVFLSTCKQVKFVYEAFCRLRPGISLIALYGKLHQQRRMNIYETFRAKQHIVLFATDVASRGLDFPTVNWVVQMDCPEDVNTYIHRSGRTARHQNVGESLLVLLPSEIEMVEKLKERKIPINLLKINMDKFQSPQKKLEALLARDAELKETAQRAFKHYIKYISLMRDKSVFDVKALNTDAFAKSLGLAVPPRIRYLQKSNKKSCSDNIQENEFMKESNDAKSSNKNDHEVSQKEDIINDFYKDYSDEEIMTIKRKNVQLDDLPEAEISDIETNKNSSKKKAITKVAIAKKILRKKIIPNKKVVFNEEGEEILDPTKSRVTELGKKYDNENQSGIDIEMAKKVLQEEDHFDKQRFREKIKEKHREEKRKAKAKKIQNRDEDQEEEEEGGDDYESDFSEPDLSFLPDPDKIYGKENENEDSQIESENSDEDMSDEYHRPSKRKLERSEEYKIDKKKKKTNKMENNDLRVEEELALKLLQS